MLLIVAAANGGGNFKLKINVASFLSFVRVSVFCALLEFMVFLCCQHLSFDVDRGGFGDAPVCVVFTPAQTGVSSVVYRLPLTPPAGLSVS